MYSLVVMMALGTAGEAPDFGRGRAMCGFSCSYSCGFSFSCRPCVSYCYTPCYSSCAPVVRCYTPVVTCFRPVITCSPMIVVPMTTPPKKEEKKKQEEVSAPATIIVNLPADAQLTFDGEQTRSTSSRRVFVTPELSPGADFAYVLKAEVMKDGKPVVLDEKKVTVQAGSTAEVTLGAASASVASR